MRIMAPLGKDALRSFDMLLAEERIECEYRADGYYEVCSTEKGLERARHEADIIQAHGYHPDTIDGDELRRREPAFGPSIIGGIHFPEAATLDPGLFLTRFAGAAVERGVAIRTGTTVRALETSGGRTTGVVVSVSGGADEVVGADAVVLATGAATGRPACR